MTALSVVSTLGCLSIGVGRVAVERTLPGLPTPPQVSTAPQLAAAAPAPNGATFSGTAALGGLYLAGRGPANHFCTGSVVDSRGGDLVLTAAHCLRNRPVTSIEFAPGFADGHAPYGTWHVTAAFVDAAWASSADPNDDFAFLVIARSKSGQAVQEVTGAEHIAPSTSDDPVLVEGYPDGLASPIRCWNRVRVFRLTQLVFDCGGYTDGTSGGPFLIGVDPRTGLGTVIGVIGGYQLGGDTPQVSYCARFGPGLMALYRLAAARSAAPPG